MDSRLPKEEKETGYTPEETALLMRVRVFVALRWLAIIAIIIATLVASKAFHIGFPTLPVYIICAFMALYNLFMLIMTRSLKELKTGFVVQRARAYGNLHILLDMVTLTAVLHFTGGIENPFIFLFVLHIIAVGIVLPYRSVYLLATEAILLVGLLVGLEYSGIIPHVNLEGFAPPEGWKDASRIGAVIVALAALLFSSAYMTTAISGELRKRQRQIVELGEQLLEKRTRELEQISSEVAKLEEERRHFVRFLGVVAHDLQSPLVATQSFISYILDGFTGQITDGQKDLLERGVRRIDGLLTLITDLLDIPRIETGQITREMREISLNEVVKRSLDGLDNVAQQKGLTLKVEMPESSPKINGANRRLQQVVTNLVSNAINYTNEGMVLVRVTDNNNDVRVEVTDSGIGILPEDLPRLFNDFFRGSNVGSKGTGLGLSISKRIVEAHGGRIWAESPDPETEKGSRFTFTLPKRLTAVHEEKRG
jgi:signal transduction histidine kinase